MPVVPAPRGGRTWLRGVLVVGDRRRVGDPRTAVACAGQHGRPRRATREALPPCDSGRHPVHRARWYRVAATAGGVPASRDGVRGLRPLGPQRAWQRILDALRDRLRVRAGRDRCPTAAIIDSQTVPAADTVPRSSRGWDGGKRMNGVKRHIAVDVNGLLLAVVVTAASIQDRDAAPTPGRTARQLLHHPAGLGRRRLPRTVAHLGERRSHPYYADHQTHPRRHWFPRPAPHLGSREKFRVDQQAPPLRARLRNQTRPPRSHGPPRHDHDHDQATRPNLTVFKHPLKQAGPVAIQPFRFRSPHGQRDSSADRARAWSTSVCSLISHLGSAG